MAGRCGFGRVGFKPAWLAGSIEAAVEMRVFVRCGWAAPVRQVGLRPKKAGSLRLFFFLVAQSRSEAGSLEEFAFDIFQDGIAVSGILHHVMIHC